MKLLHLKLTNNYMYNTSRAETEVTTIRKDIYTQYISQFWHLMHNSASEIAAIACSQASDHRNKISKKRQSVFLYSSKGKC